LIFSTYSRFCDVTAPSVQTFSLLTR